MFSTYFQLRKTIYHNEIKQSLKQIEHLFIVFIIFLGTALPALFYFSLLGFGVILDNQATSQELLIIVCAMFFMQSAILMLCKQAILGNRYFYYLRSIEPSNWRRYLADILYAVLSSPLLIILSVIIINVDIKDWPRITHGFLLLGLFVGLMLSSVYRQHRTYWSVSAMLLILPLLTSLSFVNALWVYVGLFILVQLTPNRYFPSFSKLRHVLPNTLSIWLAACFGDSQLKGGEIPSHSNALMIVSTSIALVIALTYYCAVNLKIYAHEVQFIGSSLIVLLCCTMQLRINQSIQRYTLFFEQFLWSRSVRILQYWVTTSVLIVSICAVCLIFANPKLLVLLVSGLICIYIARYFSSFYIVGWLFSVVVGALLYFVI